LEEGTDDDEGVGNKGEPIKVDDDDDEAEIECGDESGVVSSDDGLEDAMEVEERGERERKIWNS
jgi:hypothetical protein